MSSVLILTPHVTPDLGVCFLDADWLSAERGSPAIAILGPAPKRRADWLRAFCRGASNFAR